MKQLNWYQIFGKSNIPDGRTVLPTDDIQIWLHCANIWNKSYTTLAEVLADTDTLLALINSNNAVDYMVRSTTWAVAQALVPTMTSNTTPSGVASASSEVVYSGTTYYAYHAFDGSDTPGWSGNVNELGYIQYEFDSANVVNKFEYKWLNQTYAQAFGYIVQASNDNFVSDSHDLKTGSTTAAEAAAKEAIISFENSTAYKYYRLKFTGYTFSNNYCNCRELQFYSASITDNSTAMSYIGLNNYCANTLIADTTWLNAIGQSEYKESALNVKVPKMTSNTQPSGECFVDRNESWFEPYYFFDGNTSRHGGWAQNSYPHWFAYDFGRAVTIVGFEWYAYAYYGGKTIPMLLEYSDDKSTWNSYGDTVNAVQSVSWSAMATHTSGAHRYWRIYCATQGTADSIAFGEVQFYGREDV